MTRLLATLRRSVPQKGGRAALVVLGASLFLAAALYGFRGPYTYGHYGYHAGEFSTRARHTLRHGSILPGNVPGATPPGPGSYYLHHPILTHQLVTLTFALFGDRETSVRLAGLLSSAATLLALAFLVRRLYGSTAAAFAVLLFAVTPFNVWYSDHIDTGYPGLALVLLSLWAYDRWLEHGRWLDGVVSLGALALGGCFDWDPFLFAVPLGLHVAAVAWCRRGRYLVFVPCLVLALLIPIGVQALAVVSAHQWNDLVGAYYTRAAAMPLRSFFAVMAIYGRDLFGYPLLACCGAGVLLALARMLRAAWRGGAPGPLDTRALALVSLVLVMVLHLAIFRIEVVTHAYRLIYFAPAVVLGAVETLAAGVELAGAWRGPRAARAFGGVLAGALVLATLPTAWRGLLESRAHGGIPNWKTMDPNLPRAVVARELRARSHLGDRLYLHGSFTFRMEIAFYLDRDFVPSSAAMVAALPEAERRRALFVFAPSSLSTRERPIVEQLAAHHPYTRLGPYGVIDLRTVGANATAFSLTPHAPRTAWQAYWEGPYPWPDVTPEPAVHRGL
jgi:hypothetical protein